jgi:hypothetical protein
MIEYGEDVSSEPRLAPSSLNWTLATPALSEAVAETVTEEPETVEPEVGEVIETVGGVVSPAGVVAEAEEDWLELFPAASYAETVYV